MNVFKVLENNVAGSEILFFIFTLATQDPSSEGILDASAQTGRETLHNSIPVIMKRHLFMLNRELYLGGGSQQNPQKQMENENTMMKIILNPK